MKGEPFYSTTYRRVIGSVKYLMIGTRPKLAYAVGKLSQFMKKTNKRAVDNGKGDVSIC